MSFVNRRYYLSCKLALTVNLKRVMATVTIVALVAGCTQESSDLRPWANTNSIAQAFADGRLTSEQLVSYYLDQIERIDKQGPALNAIIDINPDALAQARALDAERDGGLIRSPLHGMPVVLKANIATNDAMPTTAGALALQGHLAPGDAVLVTQLREAGAVILAKTNLSEWANFRGANSASGWSALGGQTLNPHLLTHTPCGSSSGSAVAVAADLSLLAVGTETDGSIMCPAAINGIVGIKPTRGAVSGQGIIPIASAQDIAGPMARRVHDAALLLDAMLTPAAREQFGAALASHAQQASGVRKVILVRAFEDRDASLAPLYDLITQLLEARDVDVSVVDTWRLPPEMGRAELDVLIYEFRRELDQWLLDYQAPEAVNSVAKVVAFNEQRGAQALGFFGQEYLVLAAELDLDAQRDAYEQALLLSRSLAEQALDRYLLEQQADVIILPSYGPAWPIDYQSGDDFNFGTSAAAAISGYPSITLPATASGVLPMGISLVGLPWSEPVLISLAAELEHSLNGYRRPGYLTQAPRID